MCYYDLDISINMLFYSFEMAIINFFRFAKGEYKMLLLMNRKFKNVKTNDVSSTM